jgi:hypothetical protein
LMRRGRIVANEAAPEDSAAWRQRYRDAVEGGRE